MHPDHPQGWIRNEAVTPPRVPVETLFLSPARLQQYTIVNNARRQLQPIKYYYEMQNDELQTNQVTNEKT